MDVNRPDRRSILFLESTHPVLREMLVENGFTCDFLRDFSSDRWDTILPQYIAFIVRSRVVDRHLIEKARNLELIGRVGSGMDNIDVDYAEQQGITCINSPEGSRDAVGEHTLGLLIALIHHINKADHQVRKGQWNREANRGLEIKDKTIGIIGYGNMGSAFAEKLKGFGAQVLAFDKYKFNYSDEFVKETNLETLFRESDVCSLHVPLTDETSYMVNNKFFESFSKPIFLLNTARGMVVNTTHLVQQIESGNVLGAGLDVLEYEDTSYEALKPGMAPPALQYLKSSDRVVLTSHIAGYTHESKYKLAQVLAEKIIKILDT